MPGDNRSSERFLYTINRTFNLPNLYDRVPQYTGIGFGNTSLGSLPNITGVVNAPIYGSLTVPNGVFYNPGYNWTTLRGDAAAHPPTAFSASRSSATYGRYGSDKVFPAHVCMYYVIKYI